MRAGVEKRGVLSWIRSLELDQYVQHNENAVVEVVANVERDIKKLGRVPINQTD